AFHDEAGGDMGDADGGIRLVHVLAAGTAGAKGVDADVGLVDLDLCQFIHGRHDRHGAGRGMDAALGLGLRYALYAVSAGLELERAIDVAALDAGDDLLVATMLAWALAEHLDAPALQLGIA